MSNAFDKASLVMLPHAYEEGKVYSLKPTDRSGDFTFSRGTDTATRVGEDGYIKKEYTNLLEQSNQFDTTWFLNTTSVTSGQSGYDGTNDAWLLNSTGTGFPRIEQTKSTSGVFTLSVYAKPATDGFLLIRTFGADTQVWFNLNDGTVSNVTGAQYVSSSIESVGNGWYRCSVVASGSLTTVRFYPASAYGVYSTSGNGIYIQDAQLNPGLVAYPYVETTTAPVYGGLTDDMPRLDYSGGATCPSLLLEPSRTNLIGHSEYFNTSATDWRSEGNNGVTITTNETTSPEGLVNASKLQGGGASNDRLQWNFNTSNTKAMYSVFVKGTGDVVRFSIFNSRSGDRLNYDVDTNGNFTLNAATGITNHDIENYGNGWYRIWGEFTTDAALSNYFQIYSDITGSGAIYLYGAQIEAGSYPTSYIPTYGSSQTRAGEAPPFPNAFTFDNLGAGESGTFAFKFKVNGKDGVFRVFSQGGSGTWFWNGTTLTIYTTSGSFNFNMFDNINDSVGDTFHICFRKNNNLLTLFVNGQESNTRDMGTDNFSFFSHISTYTSSQSVMQMTQYDTALSNSECIALTTL